VPTDDTYTERMVGQLFARLADQKLGKELEGHLPRLFRERGARVVANEQGEYAAPRAFEDAVATVATAELDLRLARMGGAWSIGVAAPGSRKWRAVEWPAGAEWAAVDEFLAAEWERLKGEAGGR
jgi:hypothetical protein